MVTEAVFTARNLCFDGAAEGKTLSFYLLGNGPDGCIDLSSSDRTVLKGVGTKFAAVYAQYIPNPCLELKFSLSRSNDSSSHFWKIFKYPLVVSFPDSSKASISSLILEINDVLGAGRSLSIGILSDGISFDSITLDLTARSYTDSRPPQSFSYIWQSNHRPVFAPIADTVVPELNMLSFVVSACDADNDPVSITAMNLPYGAIFGGRRFFWRPLPGTAGDYTVRFSASDGKSVTFTDVLITVKSLN